MWSTWSHLTNITLVIIYRLITGLLHLWPHQRATPSPAPGQPAVYQSFPIIFSTPPMLDTPSRNYPGSPAHLLHCSTHLRMSISNAKQFARNRNNRLLLHPGPSISFAMAQGLFLLPFFPVICFIVLPTFPQYLLKLVAQIHLLPTLQQNNICFCFGHCSFCISKY